MPSSPQPNDGPAANSVAREAFKFLVSPEGSFFRDFLMTEIVQSIDALSRKQVPPFLEYHWLPAISSVGPPWLHIEGDGGGIGQGENGLERSLLKCPHS